ncbi:response regulator [Arcobacteraceae bacterium]|nr:response regulator [Arcobacteraceae bacterium]
MKFMIVDDSRLSRKKLSNFVIELGYEVICEAVDGIDGLEKFKEYSPDFILTDLEMPNMKGDELSQKILEIDNKVIIILITSITDKKELLNAIRLGVRKVMQKPIRLEKLKIAINELMDN